MFGNHAQKSPAFYSKPGLLFYSGSDLSLMLNGGYRVGKRLFTVRGENYNATLFGENTGAVVEIGGTAPRFDTKERCVLCLPYAKTGEPRKVHPYTDIILVQQLYLIILRLVEIAHVLIEHFVRKRQRVGIIQKLATVVFLMKPGCEVIIRH